MDFGGFILWIVLAAATSIGGLSTIAGFLRGQPRRWMGLGFVALGLAVTASLGTYLRQVYWLDEPLFRAAAEGDIARVEALLAAGACPYSTWEDGTPALAAARRAGHVEVASALRRAGAAEPPFVLGLD